MDTENDNDCIVIEVPFLPVLMKDDNGNTNGRKELQSIPPEELGEEIGHTGILHAYPMEMEAKAKELGFRVYYRNKARFLMTTKVKMPTTFLERK